MTHVRDNYYLETDALTAFLNDFEVIIKAQEVRYHDERRGRRLGVRHRLVEVDGMYQAGDGIRRRRESKWSSRGVGSTM